MNRRSLSRVLALGAIALVPFVPSSVAVATQTPPDEAYPPAAVVNLLDPFGCAPASITGDIGEVQVGSTVTLQLLRAGSDEVLTTVTATPDAGGHAVYSIPVPPNRFGPVVIRATGTNTVGDPFAIETSGTIVDCPAAPPGPELPATGSSGIGNWLRGGTAAVLAGVAMVVVAMRRRRHALA